MATATQDITNAHVFVGGVPTTSEVQKLMEGLGDPEQLRGKTIEWELFEGILGLLRHDGHFKSVIQAWRKKLFELGIVTDGRTGGVGITVCDDPGQLDKAESFLASSRRALLRMQKAASGTNPEKLNSAQIDRRERLHLIYGRTYMALGRGKRLLPPKKDS